MVNIHRHEINASLSQRVMASREDSLRLYFDIARETPTKLKMSILLFTIKDYIGYLSVVDPQSPRLCSLLQLLVRVSTGLFAATITPEEEITIALNDDLQISLPAQNLIPSANTNYWFDGFYAALILNESTALDVFADVSLEILRRNTNTEECMFLFIEALQSLWKRQGETMERLLEAAQATDPALLSINPDYTLNIVVPTMDLFFRIVHVDRPGFNERLAYALERHKIYWSAEDNTFDPNGFIAWGPLAAATFASSFDYPIEVTSDYLPTRLLEGECQEG